MKRWLIKIILSAVAVIIAAYILPGVEVTNFWTAVIVAVILAVLNGTVKPLLIVFTIPLTFLTFGFFLLVINSIIILLADYLITGFEVHGFWWALLLSVVLSILNSLFSEFKQGER